MAANKPAEGRSPHPTASIGSQNRAGSGGFLIGGASIRAPATGLGDIARGNLAAIRFKPQSDIGVDTLPMTIRNVKRDGDGLLLGCQFHPEVPRHHRLIADLIFANAEEWKKFQYSRRNNPGVLRGTIRFFIIAIYQTGRGLSYLMHLQKLRRAGARRPAVEAKQS